MVSKLASIVEVKLALGNALTSALGLAALPYFPDSPQPPMLAIMNSNPATIYGVTLGEVASAQAALAMGALDDLVAEADTYNLIVCAVLSRGITELAQQQADVLIAGARNTGSIASAIMSDSKLGGLVDYAVPVQVSTVGPISWAGVEYYGARVHVQVGA